MKINTPKFPIGLQIVATTDAIRALQDSGEDAIKFLRQHAAVNQGSTYDDDHALNLEAAATGERVLTEHRTSMGDVLWVITERQNEQGQRETTTILTPSEY